MSLEKENCSCPTLREGPRIVADRQTVTIRVAVILEGRAREATILVDPDAEFGQPATACAIRTRLSSARDKRGAAALCWVS